MQDARSSKLKTQNNWAQIESLCGFSLLHPSHLPPKSLRSVNSGLLNISIFSIIFLFCQRFSLAVPCLIYPNQFHHPLLIYLVHLWVIGLQNSIPCFSCPSSAIAST